MLDNGVFFWDNACVHLNGYAEEFMGWALEGKRDKVFLMTKNSGRDYKLARECLETSPRRLQTNHPDLGQFHETNYDNDPDWMFEKGGAALTWASGSGHSNSLDRAGFSSHCDSDKGLRKAFVGGKAIYQQLSADGCYLVRFGELTGAFRGIWVPCSLNGTQADFASPRGRTAKT